VIDEIISLDRRFFLFLNSLHSEYLNTLMVILSGQLIWLPLIGFFIYQAFKQNEKKFLFFFIMFLSLGLIASDVTSSYILKNIFSRLRPCREVDLKLLINSFGQKCGGKFGFVSSHASNSTVLIFYSLINLKFNKRIFYCLLLVPFFIGFSRIYLGTHYPGDILGGMIIGLFWGIIASTFLKNSQGANR